MHHAGRRPGWSGTAGRTGACGFGPADITGKRAARDLKGKRAATTAAAPFAKQLRIRAMTGTFNWKVRSWQEAQLRNSSVALLFSTALVVGSLWPAGPASSEQRSGVGPCRQGVLALIGMLDDGDQKSPDYKHAFTAVVQTCGPVAKTKPATKAAGAAQCRKLAGYMLDEIESNRMNGRAFVEVRDTFAQECAPR
jgi:hypothetical protein